MALNLEPPQPLDLSSSKLMLISNSNPKSNQTSVSRRWLKHVIST